MEPNTEPPKTPESKPGSQSLQQPANAKPPDIASALVPDTLAALHVNPDIGLTHLWRTTRDLPERGRIGIFNRSYYEEVLIVRVHPEFLRSEGNPDSPLDGNTCWQERYHSIVDLENHRYRNTQHGQGRCQSAHAWFEDVLLSWSSTDSCKIGRAGGKRFRLHCQSHAPEGLHEDTSPHSSLASAPDNDMAARPQRPIISGNN